MNNRTHKGIQCLVNESFVAQEGEVRRAGDGHMLIFMRGYVMHGFLNEQDGSNYLVRGYATYNLSDIPSQAYYDMHRQK